MPRHARFWGFLAEARAGRAAPFDFEALDGWYSVTSGVSAPEGASATVTDRDALQRERGEHDHARAACGDPALGGGTKCFVAAHPEWPENTVAIDWSRFPATA